MSTHGVEFNTLELEGKHLFKSASLDLDYKGVTLILGCNKDADPGATNAVGKSFLLRQLPELLFQQDPTSGKVSKTNGVAKLTITRRGVRYRLESHTKNGKDAFKLFKNDKDTDLRRSYLPNAIAQMCPMQEDDFYNLVYIDATRPNQLQMGTSAARRAFITSFFRLSGADDIRRFFTRELSKSAEDRAAWEELSKQVAATATELSEIKYDGLADAVETLTARHDKLSTVVQDLVAKAELVKYRDENAEPIEKLFRMVGRDADLDTAVRSYLRKLSQDLVRLEDHRDSANEYAKHCERVREYKARMRALQPKLDALKVSAERAEEGASRYDAAAATVEVLQGQLGSLRAKLLPKVDIDKDALNLDLDDIQSKLSAAKALREVSQKFKGGVCPTCNQSVKTVDIDKLNARISTLAKRYNSAVSAKAALDKQARRKEQVAAIREAEGKLQEAEAKVTKYAKYVQAHKLYLSIPEKPKPYDGEKLDVTAIDASIRKCSTKIQFLESMSYTVPMIQRCAELTDADTEAVAALPALKGKLRKLGERLPVMQATLEKAKTLRRTLKNLRTRLAELEDSKHNEEAFKLLVEAYGNAGIKKLMIQRISAHLEEYLNRYAKYVFSEKYSFKIEVGTQFNIMVTRQYARRSVTSDVRKLSGAESRAFCLLLFMSLLSLTPADRRSNLLVLDEPTIALGPEMKANFARFIKMLNKVVPHIIIVTPNPDEHYEGARTFTVVKHLGVTKLVKGRIGN